MAAWLLCESILILSQFLSITHYSTPKTLMEQLLEQMCAQSPPSLPFYIHP